MPNIDPEDHNITLVVIQYDIIYYWILCLYNPCTKTEQCTVPKINLPRFFLLRVTGVVKRLIQGEINFINKQIW